MDKYYLGLNLGSSTIKSLRGVEVLLKDFYYSSKKIKDEYNSNIANIIEYI